MEERDPRITAGATGLVLLLLIFYVKIKFDLPDAFYFFAGIIVAILVATIYQIVVDLNEGKTKITFHIISFFVKIMILGLSLYFEIKFGYKIFFATLIIIAIMGIFV
ncbi:MAG: hypothetical protein J6X78_00700 [Treponema sp.]|nr:hypothetical protein [Treponema sp.]